MYYYWGFGLNIASEIEFPELLPFQFERVDLEIKLGKIPIEIKEAETDQEFLSDDNEYVLDIKNVCRYYVRGDREVVIEPHEGIDGRSIRVYLFRKGSIPLHASGIINDGKLVLFTGDSGAGKSTTLAYLVSKGYQIFTDDVCVLKIDDADENRMQGIASYPMLKLWGDTIAKLGIETFSDTTFRVKSNLDKYGYFFYDSFITAPFPIDKIFILKKTDGNGSAAVRRLSGIEAFQQMEKQAYRKYLINNQQLRTLHFREMSVLTRTCTIFEVTRPANGTVEDLVAIIETLL